MLDAMCRHAIDDYPNECCGIMVGTGESEKRVQGCYRAANINKGDRYRIDADDYYRIDKKARAERLSIIGVYHSHPDFSPTPSAYDVKNAWPCYSYLIISVDRDKNTVAKSWMLDDEGRQLVAEDMRPE